MNKIYSLATLNKAKVAIGLDLSSSSYESIINSAIYAKKEGYAYPILVCNKKIDIDVDLPIVVSEDVEEKLVNLLVNGEVEAIVRGNLSANKTIRIIKSKFNCNNLYRITVMEIMGKNLMLAPVGIDEGDTIEDLLEFVRKGKKLADKIGIDYKIGVISGGRLEDKGRSKKVDDLLSKTEFLVEKIKEMNFNVENFGIEIERAIKYSTMILFPDGIIGNLVFRALVLVANMESFGAYASALSKVYIDTSRARTGYVLPIVLASALAK
ncbi:MAG: methanogenesis marker protein Mmp4/MtxX [Candidatus Verstraetearchaeota archaeon]|jgi:putative methanogen marker protein 4|nr:methanogenesis marker protein Mmp4/MtxX [Candidatus Verstraetearchaeota archaeon]